MQGCHLTNERHRRRRDLSKSAFKFEYGASPIKNRSSLVCIGNNHHSPNDRQSSDLLLELERTGPVLTNLVSEERKFGLLWQSRRYST